MGRHQHRSAWGPAALLLLAVVALACYTPPEPTVAPAPPAHIPGVTSVTGLDFSRFAKRGFLFTTEMYSGPYEAMGIITVTQSAAATLDSVAGFNDFGEVSRSRPIYRMEPLRIETVLDTVYARAVAMHADAIVKMTVTTGTEFLTGVPESMGRVLVPTLAVSGFAIHRLDQH